jgi:hypothetical protein
LHGNGIPKEAISLLNALGLWLLKQGKSVMDNLPAHSKEPLCTASGSQVNHTKDQALSKSFFF